MLATNIRINKVNLLLRQNTVCDILLAWRIQYSPKSIRSVINYLFKQQVIAVFGSLSPVMLGCHSQARYDSVTGFAKYRSYNSAFFLLHRLKQNKTKQDVKGMKFKHRTKMKLKDLFAVH